MGFFLGERGYFIVEGPSGSAGHGITTPGFDGVAYHPGRGELLIYDNKANARAGNVAGARAIDPAQRLGANLDALIQRVQGMSELPHRVRILDLLRRTRTAVTTGAKWPDAVRVVVSNASGQARGVSAGLASRGVGLVDYYQAPKPRLTARMRGALAKPSVAAAVGTALGSFALWLGDMGIEREVKKRLDGELAPAIRNILARGQGVLVVIALQEWAHPNEAGMRARGLLGVYVEGGPTKEAATKTWVETPRLLHGPAPGNRVHSQFAWIPPVAP